MFMGRGYGISGNVGSYMHVEKKTKLTPDEREDLLRDKKKYKYEQQREKMLKENRDNSFGRPKDYNGEGKKEPENNHNTNKYIRGMKVVHVSYGNGIIIDVHRETVNVKFDDINRGTKSFDKKTVIQKKLLLTYAEAKLLVRLRKQ